ncbi:MAG: Cna B-type domain-containing protein, partial [Ruminococcus sp.]|nr:Cna B-type domain-containing protein [Ruminococcus sp.]
YTVYSNHGEPTICYSIKIPCDDLEGMLKTGNKPVTNKILTYEDGVETGSAEGTLTITVPSDLISKSFKASSIPGYVQYTLDVNPEGKNLSNGTTIDIKDIFKTDSYIDTCHNNTETKGDKLVDILMDRIKLYKVDANGVKSELGQNEYTMKFASGKSAKDGAALLELSIPDEMHIEIQYTYKIVANENTPSVKNGCKSAVIKNNKYDTMKPGYVPPTGHLITFENKAQLISDSATAEDIHTENNFRISRSSGTISTNGRPKIKKVDVGNYSINNLDATFLMAEYKDDAWHFAEIVGDDGTVTWSETPMSGNEVDSEACDITVKKEISLEQEVLYKLVEVSVPDGYEGSKLFGDGDETKFRELIVNYLNTGETELAGEDYATFLNKYVSTHYFVYNSDISAVVTPDGISSDDIMQIRSGDDIEIPNSKLVNIGVAKEWYGGTVDDDSEITVELYWSYEKSTSGIPDSAKPASADDLGIMTSFVPVKTLKMSELKDNADAWKQIWTDLPNGKNSKPIYYYVKETAYKVDKITYTLDESGKFVSSNNVDGGYLPVYVGNALNDNGTVTIKNSSKLTLIKEWKNSNGKPISATVPEIKITVYGIDKDGNKDLLFKDVELGNSNGWRSDLSTTDINLSKYKSFEVAESPDPSGNYVVSCVFNINQNTGEITVTNKNTSATDVTVSVKKHWSDGETVHLKDSVEVVLYQSTEPLTSLDKATISNAITEKMLTEYKRTTLSANKEDEVLNWAYSWTGLPLYKINEDGSEDTSTTYYYYVFEESMELSVDAEYETTYKDSKSGINTLYDYTISNTRDAIVVQKKWIDENDEELADNEIPTSIEVVVYKLNNETKEYLTENGTTEDIGAAKRYTVNADGSWTAAIDVPTVDDIYYVEEVGLPNIWKPSVEYNGQKAGSETPVVITNKRDVHKTSIEVKKIWVGDVDEDTKALLPNNFYLLRCTMNADGTFTEYEPVHTDNPEPVEGAENIWRYDNLPVQDADGNMYYYTVDEIEIDGYSKTPAIPKDIFEAKADNSSGTVEITNTKQISITVNKDWSDGKEKHLTDNIKVQLYRSTYADDTAEKEPVGEAVTIDAKSSWTYTFSGLDVYYGDNAYYYWVEEIESSSNGYTPAYTYNDGDDDTENVVNASELGEGVVEILNESNFTDSIELPSTGGKGTAPYRTAGMLIIGGSLFGIIYYRRRRRRV